MSAKGAAPKKTRELPAWIRLDNAAKIYPPSRTRGWAAMFRMSATLGEDVDPALLERAQAAVLKRLPAFAYRLRSGAFWYYFEALDGAPPVQPDVGNPLVRMDLEKNGHFMFRVRYYRARIAVEYFHAVTDGTGGMSFLLTLTAEYLRLKHGVRIPAEGLVLSCADRPSPEESEDSFLRYARKTAVGRAERPAYRIPGIEEGGRFLNITTGILSKEAVAARARSSGASVTAFLTAALIDSYQELQFADSRQWRRRLPVKVQVPVNLRRFYGSRTLRNFASYVNVGVDSDCGRSSFAEILNVVKHTLGLELTEKRLNGRFSANVQTERNPLVRGLPLFLKAPLMKTLFFMQGDRYNSTILSNLGVVELPDEMRPYVRRLDFVLGGSAKNPVACACVTYGDKLYLNITRKTRDPLVERTFFTRLVKMGLHVEIESNRR